MPTNPLLDVMQAIADKERKINEFKRRLRVKGIFGETTRAKTTETVCLEAERKFWAYERIRKYAKA